MFWGAKKKIQNIFLKNFLATALKSSIKWLLWFFFIIWKSLKNLKKLELSPQNFRYDVLHLLYSGCSYHFSFCCRTWPRYCLCEVIEINSSNRWCLYDSIDTKLLVTQDERKLDQVEFDIKNQKWMIIFPLLINIAFSLLCNKEWEKKVLLF